MKPARTVISSSLFSLVLGFVPFSASAQIFKCVDADGKVTYGNDGGSIKGCKQLSGEQSVSTISMRSSSPPAVFPKISDDTQRERDKTRRQILEKELDSEQLALEGARKEFAEQETISHPNEAIATVNPTTGMRRINYQKKLDRLQSYKDAVERHERNIEALTQELSGLR
jgi:hypothetical protein